MKDGKPWGVKQHIEAVDYTVDSNCGQVTLMEGDIENMARITVYTRNSGGAGCNALVDIQFNEMPDHPAADWYNPAGYPAALLAGNQDVYHCDCYHKRFRVRIHTSVGCGCHTTVLGTLLGIGWWGETKE